MKLDSSDLELRLHLRYGALRDLWRGVVWCEDGKYYIPTDEIKPDWNSKCRISLAEFDALLREVEDAMRKVAASETIQESTVKTA